MDVCHEILLIIGITCITMQKGFLNCFAKFLHLESIWISSYLFLSFLRLGHAEHEITAAFAKFDKDGNQILDEEEQKRMRNDLEEKRVRSKRDGSIS